MMKNEIEKRIDELEKARFYLAMKDRWDSRDYAMDREWFNELLALKKELEKMA